VSKGFVWFCQNNSDTDYVKCSIELAKSIKRHNKHNNVCVIVDRHSKFQSEYVDAVRVMEQDHSSEHKVKWANEHKVFSLSPFKHTIKLEADMIFTQNTDWWWYHLWQHDMVFSVDCKNYKDETVKDKTYRNLFVKNFLPNIYNGLTYFRRSVMSKKFFDLCRSITENWKAVRETILINCHDEYPSTDVVYALAYRIVDPTQKHLVDYPWFKFIHHKPAIHGLRHVKDHNNYLMPALIKDSVYLGTQRIDRLWHYHDKNMMERLHARIF